MLVSKASNLSPSLDPDQGRAQGVWKQSSPERGDACGAVFACAFADLAPAGHPPASSRERRSLSWVLPAIVAFEAGPLFRGNPEPPT